jgi:3-dehydroquinate synthase
VDSSVGGKTGVNLPQGKNLVGAFYQPLMVMIDVSTLVTLPEREYLGGLAEVIKYGIVLDNELFNYIEEHVAEILQREPASLEKIIARCCRIKADVVGKDERETGLRAVLNYGHTLGHAVEALTLYSRYSHGEAVAIGMVAAAGYSELKGLSTKDDTTRIVNLIERVGLPVSAPTFSAYDYSAALMRDKKARDTGVTFVCNKGIGDFSFVLIEDMTQLLTTAGIGE